MALEALIFDVDGTLAETEETHRRALNDTFASFGLPWDWDRATYRRLLRIMGGKERLLHFIEFDGPEGADRAFDRLDEIHAAKNVRYAELVRDGAVTLRPGVERLLREARGEALRIGIATTTSRRNVEALLTATIGDDWRDLFDAIAAGDEAPAKKPAPDVYLLALERLRVPPSAAIAFEDTSHGLRSARAAGVRCLVTPSEYSDDQNFAGAAAVFDQLGEPTAPARHLAGAGAGKAMVTVPLLRGLAD
ncbi:HAD-IA family hydrolase [Chenggangzhangella methanolivorans]|uniref:HAD-IA family hydrolase n=1 Tax=Chenggangzhangella methanolivorans TaxID=1437009 RepID=A0A9E6UHM5_9HYPH|nr:HAD-IA family hydrolase [Chenggangzhangella methanolivorans]QZN99927.1 HAD-IA family hydrolase [Chenggangzhangella methanolivorans]